MNKQTLIRNSSSICCNTNEKPLVTFALFVYNQEKYIRESIKGALSQNYSPLEIIISDDYSTDNSWSIIQEIAQEYKGQHQVIFVRNEKNLGITSHVNKIFAMARGELLVMAAGDDISVPYRTSAFVEAWIAHGKPDAALHSAVRTFSDSPCFIGKVRAGKGAYIDRVDLNWYLNNKKIHMPIIGASAAYTRSLFERFGPIMHGGMVEDMVFVFRALLIGKIIYVDQTLIQYRINGDNISMRHHVSKPEKWEKWIFFMQKCIHNHEVDYMQYCNMNNISSEERILDSLKEINDNYGKLKFLLSRNLYKIFYALWHAPGMEGIYHRILFAFFFFLSKDNLIYQVVVRCNHFIKINFLCHKRQRDLSQRLRNE